MSEDCHVTSSKETVPHIPEHMCDHTYNDGNSDVLHCLLCGDVTMSTQMIRFIEDNAHNTGGKMTQVDYHKSITT